MKAASNNSRVYLRAQQRLDAICREIASGAFPSTRRLAGSQSVSERTVKRIIAFLKDEYGAPLASDRRRGGWYFTEPNWTLPPLTLAEGDFLAFFIAENCLRLTGHSPEAEILRKALGKIAAMLPQEVSVNLAAMNDSLSFENRPFVEVDPVLLQQIASAATGQRTVEFKYFSAYNGKIARRRADVHLLHNYAGDWFAISWDHEREDFRDFHVGRISDYRETGDYFEKRRDFDRDRYLERGFSMMRGGRLTTVVIVFDPYQSRWIRERGSFHPQETREDLPDGSLRLTFQVGENGLEAVARFCLTYSGHCRVEKPKKLHEIVQHKLQAALELNQ